MTKLSSYGGNKHFHFHEFNFESSRLQKSKQKTLCSKVKIIEEPENKGRVIYLECVKNNQARIFVGGVF